MLFNSTEFLRFFLIFLACYIVTRRSLPARNALITLGSYYFYAGWDYRFTALLFLTSLVDFHLGQRIQGARSPSRRKLYLAASMISNLAVLGFFKYADFAVEAAANVLDVLGFDMRPVPLGIVLPVGISFYTFQSLGYTVDVYRGTISAESSFVRFAGYVAFFPQLVAGPIERANHLLPQFSRTLLVDSADILLGGRLIIQGLFKKVVIADSLGRLVELSHGATYVGSPVLLLGTIAFGFQIYCDFSGYSDIARGLALWLGFKLSRNFERPYLSTSIRDFWGTWHMSLSTWLRDYLYIPLGGGRHGRKRMIVALMVTMVLGGLWHGARFNFLLWGLWHGFALVVFHLWSRCPSLAGRVPGWAGWAITMIVVFYGWLLFRASSVDDLWVWHATLLSDWHWPPWGDTFLRQVCLLAIPLFLAEIVQGRRSLDRLPKPLLNVLSVAGNALLLLGVMVFWTDDPPAFIYFQF